MNTTSQLLSTRVDVPRQEFEQDTRIHERVMKIISSDISSNFQGILRNSNSVSVLPERFTAALDPDIQSCKVLNPISIGRGIN